MFLISDVNEIAQVSQATLVVESEKLPIRDFSLYGFRWNWALKRRWNDETFGQLTSAQFDHYCYRYTRTQITKFLVFSVAVTMLIIITRLSIYNFPCSLFGVFPRVFQPLCDIPLVRFRRLNTKWAHSNNREQTP